MNVKYPHFGRIEQLFPNPHIMLGHDIYWTLKVDGSNTGIYFNEEGEIKIRSRNMDHARFFEKVQNLPVYDKIVEMMVHHKDNFDNDFTVFGELLSKGKSPTGLKTFDKDDFVVFDIYDCNHDRFFSHNTVCSLCGPFEIPVVDLIGKCNVTSIEELYDYRDAMLDATKGEEGVVAKIYHNVHKTNRDNYLFVKEKHFIPKVRKKVSEDRNVKLPQLDEGEIRKCIAKVYDELSLDEFKNAKISMPMIAKEVSLECKQQNCHNGLKLFNLYLNFIKDE